MGDKPTEQSYTNVKTRSKEPIPHWALGLPEPAKDAQPMVKRMMQAHTWPVKNNVLLPNQVIRNQERIVPTIPMPYWPRDMLNELLTASPAC